MRSDESGRTQEVEHGRRRAGDINARAMDVTAAQESEAGKDTQGRERQGERTSEEYGNDTRGTKRTCEEDEGYMENNRRQREQAAEQECRATMVEHNTHHTPTYTTTTVTSQLLENHCLRKLGWNLAGFLCPY